MPRHLDPPVAGRLELDGADAVNADERDPPTSMESYLRAIERIPLLSRNEERLLVERAFTGGEREAVEQLVRSKLRLVVRICRGYRGRRLPLEDLVNEGNLGLLEAAARFDPHGGQRFPAFAVLCIRRAVVRAVRCQDPDGAAFSWRSIEADPRPARPSLPQEEERSVDDGPAREDDGLPPDRSDGPETRLLRAESLDLIRQAVERLDEPDRFVLMRRFGLRGGEPASMKAIAERLGVTPEMVRLIESRAKRRMRMSLAARRESERSGRPLPLQQRRRLSLHQPEQRSVDRPNRT